jgi:hypothetical protein
MPYTPTSKAPLPELSCPYTANCPFAAVVLADVVVPVTPLPCALTPETPGPVLLFVPPTHAVVNEQLVIAIGIMPATFRARSDSSGSSVPTSCGVPLIGDAAASCA